MPNTREKLIELLAKAEDEYLEVASTMPIREIKEFLADIGCYGFYADHLIANGVTVQKWIPVTERLPKSGDVVLGYMSFGEYRTLKWKNDTQRWEGLLLDYSMDFVTHWMPLPEPPKGE